MTGSLDRVYAIILAAGSSSRLGKPKQLLEWQGRSFLQHAIDNACSLLNERVIVVLGANAEAIRSSVELDCVQVVLNPDWQEGIAASIRAGIAALPGQAEAALVLLADQPLVGSEALKNLLDNWQNARQRIAVCYYNDTVGVPALFPSAYFDMLSALRGDLGAKRLLLEQSENLLKIPLPEAELDIDTNDDLDQLTGIIVPGSKR